MMVNERLVARLEPIATVDEARVAMMDAIEPVDAHEQVALDEACDRVLFEDIKTTIDLPPFPQAAMDGFAVACGLDLNPLRFRFVGTAYAGHPYAGSLASGECIGITTGASIPSGVVAVVAKEETTRQGDWIAVEKQAEPGAHIRPRAEECRAGDIVLAPGRRLRAAQIGLLAASGVAVIPVYRRLRVALFSSGDELRMPGHALGPGEIYDSNRALLKAALKRAHVDCVDGGMLPDEAEACRNALAEAAGQADLMLISGGASVGEADVLGSALASLGEVRPWRVAMKPGQRLLFGSIGECVTLGLPGNPIAALVAFNQFALPLLRKRAGECPIEPALRFQARLTRSIQKRAGRREFVRAVLSYESGDAMVTPLLAQGSAMLRSVSDANCFIVAPDAAEHMGAGDAVDVEPFAGWL